MHNFVNPKKPRFNEGILGFKAFVCNISHQKQLKEVRLLIKDLGYVLDILNEISSKGCFDNLELPLKTISNYTKEEKEKIIEDIEIILIEEINKMKLTNPEKFV